MIDFEHTEDQEFFQSLLAYDNRFKIDDFKSMFDFRLPKIKRKEFNKIRDEILEQLMHAHGVKCMLRFDCCDLDSGIAVDHLIPISSNKLNKELRNLEAEPGKKVKTQSFGSNHIDNLILACNRCNNHKKHRFLDRDKLIDILKEKESNL